MTTSKAAESRVQARRDAWADRRIADLFQIQEMLREEWDNPNSVILGSDEAASSVHEAIDSISEAIDSLRDIRTAS